VLFCHVHEKAVSSHSSPWRWRAAFWGGFEPIGLLTVDHPASFPDPSPRRNPITDY